MPAFMYLRMTQAHVQVRKNNPRSLATFRPIPNLKQERS